MAKKRSSFRGKVGKDAQKSVRESRGHLNLPDGIRQYGMEDGTRKVKLDIMPYEITDPKHPNRDESEDIALVGDLWYRRPYKLHRNVGSDEGSFVCPKSVGKPCPICEYQKKRFAEGADKEETKLLYPKDRNLYVVIPIGDKKLDEVPMIWDMSQALFQDILKEALEEEPENEIFPDLEEGKTLEIAFKWKTLGKNSFPEARNITFLDRDAYDEDILEDIPNLDNVLKVLTYEELSNKFFEIEEEVDGGNLREEDEEEEEVKVERSSRRKEKEKVEPTARTRKSRTTEKTQKDAPPTMEELERLSRENLETMVKSYKLDVEIDDYDDSDEGDDELRIAIYEAFEDLNPKEEPPARKGKTIERTSSRKSRKQEPEVEEEEEEEEKPTRATRDKKAPKEKTSTSKNKCPYGHRFGTDCEKFDDCDTCDLWNECLDAKDNM